MTGLRISIQSERDAHYLEDRVDAFLNTFEGYLSGMTDEQFEKERASLVNRLREEPKNLVFETTGYWMQIFSGYYDFERKARDADKIEKLSKDDMLQFFQKRISPNSQERAKISVHMQSQHANKATVDAAREAIKAAGAEETEALTAALDAQPSLLADKLVEVAGAELKDAKDVQEKIRNSHAPTSIGDKKEIFTDGQEIRKRMTLGAPASPTDEYKEILAKL
jgi:insulysin